jgi:hypothetical protein
MLKPKGANNKVVDDGGDVGEVIVLLMRLQHNMSCSLGNDLERISGELGLDQLILKELPESIMGVANTNGRVVRHLLSYEVEVSLGVDKFKGLAE